MKTVLFFLLTTVLSVSCFATTYRVYSIKGTFSVNTPNGARTLSKVNQTFECNNPKRDITPNTNNGVIVVVEAKAGATIVTQIASCSPSPCVSTAQIRGGNKREWDAFASDGTQLTPELERTLNSDLTAFSAVAIKQEGTGAVLRNDNTRMNSPASKINTTTINKANIKNVPVSRGN